jgi:hypothetical protein
MYTQRIRVQDLLSAGEEFDGPAVYARTKRAQVILTELWAERLKGTGVVVHAMHPGWADTPGLRSSLPRFHRATKLLLRTPEEAADTIVWLGSAPDPGRSSGGFWHDRRQRPTHRVPWTEETPEDRERLWPNASDSAAGTTPKVWPAQTDKENPMAFRGDNSTVVFLDRITFEPSDEGTRITYDAELSLKWPFKIADPLLRLAFNRVGDRALASMRKTLGAQQPTKLPALSTACGRILTP